MKISSLPFALLLFLVFAVPAAIRGADAPENVRLEVFDFFDFGAMRKSPSGELLRKYIFDDLKNSPEAADLFAAVNSVCGTSVPESVKRATVAVFADPALGRIDAAKFEFDGAAADCDASRFALLEAHAGNSHWRAPALFGLGAGTLPTVPFPDALAKKLPAPFALDAKTVFFHADSEKKTCSLITLRADPKNAEPVADARTDELGDLLLRASREGTLVFRKFPRRTHDAKADEEFLIEIPAGEFSVSELGARTKLTLDFHCADAHETAFFERFFRLLRTKLISGANAQDEASRQAISAVGEALSVSAERGLLRIEIDCAASDFSEFLKRREVWETRAHDRRKN